MRLDVACNPFMVWIYATLYLVIAWFMEFLMALVDFGDLANWNLGFMFGFNFGRIWRCLLKCLYEFYLLIWLNWSFFSLFNAIAVHYWKIEWSVMIWFSARLVLFVKAVVVCGPIFGLLVIDLLDFIITLQRTPCHRKRNQSPRPLHQPPLITSNLWVEKQKIDIMTWLFTRIIFNRVLMILNIICGKQIVGRNWKLFTRQP